jgi:hypothetical protein
MSPVTLLGIGIGLVGGALPGLIYLDQQVHTPGAVEVRLTVMATVLLSIFAHGLTAGPGIALYARTVDAQGRDEVTA